MKDRRKDTESYKFRVSYSTSLLITHSAESKSFVRIEVPFYKILYFGCLIITCKSEIHLNYSKWQYSREYVKYFSARKQNFETFLFFKCSSINADLNSSTKLRIYLIYNIIKYNINTVKYNINNNFDININRNIRWLSFVALGKVWHLHRTNNVLQDILYGERLIISRGNCYISTRLES